MDAASCYIFGMVLVPVDDPEPSRSEVRRLLKMGWAHKRRYAALLFLPAGRLPALLPAEAKRLGITVVPVQESQLLVFIGEGREGLKERFESGRASRDV
jgi:hypothetical protein